jgi:hypothetical protein
MKRLLQLTEEDDDASSSLAACLAKPMFSDSQSQLSYCKNEEVKNSQQLNIYAGFRTYVK